MSRQTMPFKHRHAHHRETQNLRTASPGFLKISFLLALSFYVSACATIVPAVLTAKDRAALNAGDKGLVLVRVLCTVDDKPFDPCIYRRNDPMHSDKFFVVFALGSFKTFGEPGHVKIQALSDELLDKGWALLLLSPGIHYLYIQGPDRCVSDYYDRCIGKETPRWRIDIPDSAKLIYAGTLTLAGKVEGKLMFGDKIIRPVTNQEVPLRDERELADSLLARYFPGTAVHNILMRQWYPGDPFIFRSPLPGSMK